MNSIIAKVLKTHTSSNNTNDYTPVFVNQGNVSNSPTYTGVGYYTDTIFGVHNPSTSAITVGLSTISQGTAGSVNVRIQPGETFYATVSKVTVDSGVTVVLLGIPTTFSR